MDNLEFPLELQVEIRLRDRGGHNLRHFSTFIDLPPDPSLYNLMLAIILETLTQEQKGQP